MDESPSTESSSETSSSQDSSSSTTNQKKVRRAILPILDKRFQIKVTLCFLLLILLSHLFLLTLHYRNLRNIGNTVGKTLVQMQTLQERQRKIFVRDLILGTFVIGAFIGLIVFYLTQKVSGPLFAMSRVLDEMGQGNFSERLVLRQGDELHWLAEKINATQDTLQERLNKK